MARNVFFSFHYQNDVFRVNQIRSIPNIIAESAAGFRDGSLWEEAKRKGDAAIQGMIDRALIGTSVTVVCIGSGTAGRKYINYEIRESLKRRNGVIGLRINHLTGHNRQTDLPGLVPPLLTQSSVPIYNYTDHRSLGEWIERAASSVGR